MEQLLKPELWLVKNMMFLCILLSSADVVNFLAANEGKFVPEDLLSNWSKHAYCVKSQVEETLILGFYGLLSLGMLNTLSGCLTEPLSTPCNMRLR